MTDIVDSRTRSQMMAGIKGKNTRPELMIRSGLHTKGFRYRLHDKRLPGRPDLVFPKYRAIIEVNGCFWHLHDCNLFKWPSTRNAFWREKLNKNRERDIRNLKCWNDDGWRVLVIWECALKGSGRKPLAEVIAEACCWLRTGNTNKEIFGRTR